MYNTNEIIVVVLQELHDDFYFMFYQNNHSSIVSLLWEHDYDDDCIEINILTENDGSLEHAIITTIIITVSVLVGACGAFWIYLAIKKCLCKSKQSSLHLQASQNQDPAINNTVYVSRTMS